jgi:hypothetical protein
MSTPALSSEPMKVVHQGRGGYIQIDATRYDIEHIEGGRFSIRFHGCNDEHRRAIEALIASEPDKWWLDRPSGERSR